MNSILYLFVNEKKSFFKIGITDNLKVRYEHLSSIWGNFDLGLSCTVRGTRRDMSRLEKTLHYLLEKWRVQHLAKHEGYSEWFSMDCFGKSLEIIDSTLKLRGTYSDNSITSGISFQENQSQDTKTEKFITFKKVSLKSKKHNQFNKTGTIIGGKRGIPIYKTNPSIPDELTNKSISELLVADVKQAAGLSKAGLAIFEVVYNLVRATPNSDEVKLAFYVASRQIEDLTERTYRRGLRELLDKEFLFRSPLDGVFFVNIRYMFNGDRLAFVKAYHLQGAAPKPAARRKKRLAAEPQAQA